MLCARNIFRPAEAQPYILAGRDEWLLGGGCGRLIPSRCPKQYPKPCESAKTSKSSSADEFVMRLGFSLLEVVDLLIVLKDQPDGPIISVMVVIPAN